MFSVFALTYQTNNEMAMNEIKTTKTENIEHDAMLGWLFCLIRKAGNYVHLSRRGKDTKHIFLSNKGVAAG
jgi:hypothetical protein